MAGSEKKIHMPRLPMRSWGLDGTFWSSRKLFAENIHKSVVRETRQGSLEFWYHDRPVSRVEVMGIITDITRRQRKIWISLDDGTGIIHCVKYVNENQFSHLDPIKGVTVGSLVTIRGTFQTVETNEFPYSITINVASLDAHLDPNLELFHWANTMYLHKNEYLKAWERPIGLKFDAVAYTTCSCLAVNAATDASTNLASQTIQTVHTSGASRRQEVRAALFYCPCVACACIQDPYCEFRIDLLQKLLSRTIAHRNRIISAKSTWDEGATQAAAPNMFLEMTTLEGDTEIASLASRFMHDWHLRQLLQTAETDRLRSFNNDGGLDRDISKSESKSESESESESEEEEEENTGEPPQKKAKKPFKEKKVIPGDVATFIKTCVANLRLDGVLVDIKSRSSSMPPVFVVADLQWICDALQKEMTSGSVPTSATVEEREKALMSAVQTKWKNVPLWRLRIALCIMNTSQSSSSSLRRPTST